MQVCIHLAADLSLLIFFSFFSPFFFLRIMIIGTVKQACNQLSIVKSTVNIEAEALFKNRADDQLVKSMSILDRAEFSFFF